MVFKLQYRLVRGLCRFRGKNVISHLKAHAPHSKKKRIPMKFQGERGNAMVW